MVAPDDVALARAALAATRAVPAVADISRGRYAIARTYGLGGAAVEGIHLARGPGGLRVEVHVVARLAPLPALAEAVRAAIAAALRGRGAPVAAVDVWVDDLRPAAAGEEAP